MTAGAGVRLGEAAERLGLQVICGEEKLQSEITGAIVSDLLSYVMAHGKAGYLWVTIQTHSNIVAVAALAGLAGIVIAGGLEPEEDTVMRAEDEGIPLFTSAESAYAIAGQLYEAGVR